MMHPTVKACTATAVCAFFALLPAAQGIALNGLKTDVVKRALYFLHEHGIMKVLFPML